MVRGVKTEGSGRVGFWVRAGEPKEVEMRVYWLSVVEGRKCGFACNVGT